MYNEKSHIFWLRLSNAQAAKYLAYNGKVERSLFPLFICSPGATTFSQNDFEEDKMQYTSTLLLKIDPSNSH